MADETQSEKAAIEKEYQGKIDALNAGRAGVGTRAFYGFTRGKGSMPFVYEKFDIAVPASLPKSVEEFMSVTKVDADKDLTDLLIDGYNEKLYTEASDPIAEYVNPAWTPETQTRFRLVVRGYAASAQVSIEAAVELIKPGFEKAAASV